MTMQDVGHEGERADSELESGHETLLRMKGRET